MNPSWDSKYTTNINTEMNYWPVESGNLSACFEPLARMMQEIAVRVHKWPVNIMVQGMGTFIRILTYGEWQHPWMVPPGEHLQ